jgi:hypothetical protein
VRIALLALLALVALDPACASHAADDVPLGPYWIHYTVAGALSGDRTISERDEERVGCTIANDPTLPTGAGRFLVVSAVANYGESHAPGIYLRVPGYHGVGTYELGSAAGIAGLAYVYDDSNLESCAQSDAACFVGGATCSLTLDTLDTTPGVVAAPPGIDANVRWALGGGHFACASLTNATGKTTSVSGTFYCRVGDWSLSSSKP